jgi:hypothetical protein
MEYRLLVACGNKICNVETFYAEIRERFFNEIYDIFVLTRIKCTYGQLRKR